MLTVYEQSSSARKGTRVEPHCSVRKLGLKLELKEIVGTRFLVFLYATNEKFHAVQEIPMSLLKVTVDLQGCLSKSHSYARRLYYNHRKV